MVYHPSPWEQAWGEGGAIMVHDKKIRMKNNLILYSYMITHIWIWIHVWMMHKQDQSSGPHSVMDLCHDHPIKLVVIIISGELIIYTGYTWDRGCRRMWRGEWVISEWGGREGGCLDGCGGSCMEKGWGYVEIGDGKWRGKLVVQNTWMNSSSLTGQLWIGPVFTITKREREKI